MRYHNPFFSSDFELQVPETGTGLAGEENFSSYLLTYEEAMKRLWVTEQTVLRYAWAVFQNTLDIEDALAKGTAVDGQPKIYDKGQMATNNISASILNLKIEI